MFFVYDLVLFYDMCIVLYNDIYYFSLLSFYVFFFVGYYCDNSVIVVGDLVNFICFEGYYCFIQIERYNQYFCFLGIYNNRIMRVNELDCQWCFLGFYCQSLGFFIFEGFCYVGQVIGRKRKR